MNVECPEGYICRFNQTPEWLAFGFLVVFAIAMVAILIIALALWRDRP